MKFIHSLLVAAAASACVTPLTAKDAVIIAGAHRQRFALNLRPPKYSGYAEAFAPLVGRSQGPSVFDELPKDPAPGQFPSWCR